MTKNTILSKTYFFTLLFHEMFICIYFTCFMHNYIIFCQPDWLRESYIMVPFLCRTEHFRKVTLTQKINKMHSYFCKKHIACEPWHIFVIVISVDKSNCLKSFSFVTLLKPNLTDVLMDTNSIYKCRNRFSQLNLFTDWSSLFCRLLM